MTLSGKKLMQLSSSPEEKDAVDIFNSSLASLISSGGLHAHFCYIPNHHRLCSRKKENMLKYIRKQSGFCLIGSLLQLNIHSFIYDLYIKVK